MMNNLSSRLVLSKIRFDFSFQKFRPVSRRVADLDTAGQKIKAMIKRQAQIDEIAEFYFQLAQEAKKLELSMQDRKLAQSLFTPEVVFLLKNLTLRDASFILYFFHSFKHRPSDVVQDVIQRAVRPLIMKLKPKSAQAKDNINLMFYALKIQLFHESDPVWEHLISLVDGDYFSPQNIGRFMWGCASLMRFNLNQKLKKDIFSCIMKNKHNFLERIQEISFYTVSLLMQSFIGMEEYDEQIWKSLIQNFKLMYKEERDDYSLAYCLWGILQYQKATSRIVFNPLEIDALCKFIQDKESRFSKENLLMALWSLQKLGVDSQQFWKTIYVARFRGSLKDLEKDDLVLATQIFSIGGTLEQSDWETLDNLLIAVFESKHQLSEKSLTNLYQSFTSNNQGSAELWERLEKKTLEDFKNISLKSVISIMYSLTRRLEVSQELLDHLLSKVNTHLKDQSVKVGELAIILWSLTHHQSEKFDPKLVIKLLTKEYLLQATPKDISQLIWSLGYLKVKLKRTTQKILQEALEEIHSKEAFNPNDVAQILQSARSVFENNVVFEKFLTKYSSKLNITGTISALQYAEIMLEELTAILEGIQSLPKADLLTHKEKLIELISKFTHYAQYTKIVSTCMKFLENYD